MISCGTLAARPLKRVRMANTAQPLTAAMMAGVERESAILGLDHAKDAIGREDDEEGDQAPLTKGHSFRSDGLIHDLGLLDRTVLAPTVFS